MFLLKKKMYTNYFYNFLFSNFFPLQFVKYFLHTSLSLLLLFLIKNIFKLFLFFPKVFELIFAEIVLKMYCMYVDKLLNCIINFP